jgi:Tol biopolymer transport system component/DNA-binding winged helix-turn-helix (wHTH) protein
MLETRDRLYYEFDGFRLDAAKKCLWRADELVALTPKALDTLMVLLRERGNIVEKETLLNEVWPDTFVEEATLAQNIFTLRKTLGADQAGRQYIETIPRRGYRFAAEVREFAPDDGLLLIRQRTRTHIIAEETSDSPNHQAPPAVKPTRWPRLVVAGLALAGAGALWLGVKLLPTVFKAPQAATAFQRIEITKLTDNGYTRRFALSPDGNYVAYAVAEGDKQTLFLRQTKTATAIPIVPASASSYAGVTFSPDGSQIFYATYPKNSQEATLYQVSALGGAPRQVMRDIDSPVSFSPDGKRFAFVRGFPQQNESALMIADADGGNERKLNTRPARNAFAPSGPAWSPDGKVLACAANYSSVDALYMNAVIINVADGAEKPFSSQHWSWVGQTAWLKDGSGLLVTAWEQDSTATPDQVWLLPYPQGESRRVTTGINGYYGLNITADARALLAVQWIRQANFWVTPDFAREPARRVTHGSGDNYGPRLGMNWTPDGRLLYGSNANGLSDLWMMNKDGGETRQITTDAGPDYQPSMTPDGRYIVYAAHRAEGRHIWRMDADGKNQLRLTSGTGDETPSVSPDGQWVYYTSLVNDRPSLWRVSINGGAARQLTQTYFAMPVVSPDGKFIAGNAPHPENKTLKLSIISADNGQIVKQFDQRAGLNGASVRWGRDGQSLFYLQADDKLIFQIWQQPLAGGPPRQITKLDGQNVFRFALAPDGKQLAYEAGRDIDDLFLIRDADSK